MHSETAGSSTASAATAAPPSFLAFLLPLVFHTATERSVGAHESACAPDGAKHAARTGAAWPENLARRAPAAASHSDSVAPPSSSLPPSRDAAPPLTACLLPRNAPRTAPLAGSRQRTWPSLPQHARPAAPALASATTAPSAQPSACHRGSPVAASYARTAPAAVPTTRLAPPLPLPPRPLAGFCKS